MTSLLRCVAQVDFISKSYHVSIYQLYNKILICTSLGGVVYAKWKKHVRFFDLLEIYKNDTSAPDSMTIFLIFCSLVRKKLTFENGLLSPVSKVRLSRGFLEFQ